MDDLSLVKKAAQARECAHAPYSKFAVGAALLTNDQTVIVGCNVENASYGLSICAERVALCSMVVERHTTFNTIAIVATPLASPCGACRQFMAEFNSDARILLADANDLASYQEFTLGQLLPEQFRLES